MWCGVYGWGDGVSGHLAETGLGGSWVFCGVNGRGRVSGWGQVVVGEDVGEVRWRGGSVKRHLVGSDGPAYSVTAGSVASGWGQKEAMWWVGSVGWEARSVWLAVGGECMGVVGVVGEVLVASGWGQKGVRWWVGSVKWSRVASRGVVVAAGWE